jgi:hypothetical protein
MVVVESDLWAFCHKDERAVVRALPYLILTACFILQLCVQFYFKDHSLRHHWTPNCRNCRR